VLRAAVERCLAGCMLAMRARPHARADVGNDVDVASS
jgi:hypothetical protein